MWAFFFFPLKNLSICPISEGQVTHRTCFRNHDCLFSVLVFILLTFRDCSHRADFSATSDYSYSDLHHACNDCWLAHAQQKQLYKEEVGRLT